MITLILAIAGAWILLEVTGFILALVIAAIGCRFDERQSAKEPIPPEMPLGEPLDDQGRPYT